jgi:radical SAM superfamily enzyme YgiQ (UPF0313 family)
MDSRVLLTLRTSDGGRLLRTHRFLDERTAIALFEQCHKRAERMRERIVGQRTTWSGEAEREEVLARLAEVTAYTPERLMQEHSRFHALYKPVSVLPPDQYLSVVVQVVHGCPYNQCTFCDLYRDRDFEIIEGRALSLRVKGVRSFFGRALGMRKGLFLGDGNALCLPASKLLTIVDTVNSEFADTRLPSDGIFAFGDVRAVLHKSVAELEELRRRGLKRVYLGLESGAQELLQFLQKPSTRTQQIESVRRLKRAGLSAAVIFLAGVGGGRFTEIHLRETLALIHALPFQPGDLIYASRFYAIEGAPYADQVRSGDLDLLSDQQITQQIAQLRSGIDPAVLKTAKFAPYDLGGFVY